MPRATKTKTTNPAPVPAPEAPAPPKMLQLGKVGNQEITMPDLSPETAAIRKATAVYEGYKGSITCEDEKVFINTELRKLVNARKDLEARLHKITGPLVEIRRQALQSKQAAENEAAATFAAIETGVTILKGELLRWDTVQERKRLAQEAEARRAAEAEQRRIREAAQREAEETARKHLEEQQRAAALEAEGKAAEAERLRQDSDAQLEAAAENIEAAEQEAENVMAQAIVPSQSVKLAGTAITGTWKARIVNVGELLAGIVDGSTPLNEAVRARVDGKLVAVNGDLNLSNVTELSIGMAWFNDQARKLEKNFSYRGVEAYFARGVRVS